FTWYAAHPVLHSFPTRRSSDLRVGGRAVAEEVLARELRAERGVDPVELGEGIGARVLGARVTGQRLQRLRAEERRAQADGEDARSEEHTSELQSRSDLVCRLLL